MSHPYCERCNRPSPDRTVPADWSDDPEPGGALLCPGCVAEIRSGGWDSLPAVEAELAIVRHRLTRVPLRTPQQRERGLWLLRGLDATLARPEPSAPVRLVRRAWRRWVRGRQLAG